MTKRSKQRKQIPARATYSEAIAVEALFPLNTSVPAAVDGLKKTLNDAVGGVLEGHVLHATAPLINIGESL